MRPGAQKPFRPARALGQSFLRSEKVIDALVAALGVEPGDEVLEIGPGRGALTRRLVELPCRVIAVELDRRLVEYLNTEFAGQANLTIVRGDFLAYELTRAGSGRRPCKVIGNLPYVISSQVIFRLLDFPDAWQVAVLTTQREFADRVLAAPGTRRFGVPAVLLERVCRREKLFSIPATSFRPAPDVVSTGLRLVRRPEPLFEVADEPLFRAVVKACFGQRRKTVANNVAGGLGCSKDDATRILALAGIDPRARSESLIMEQFRRLYESVTAALRAENPPEE